MNGLEELKRRIKSVTEEEKGFHIFSNERRRAIFRELSRLPCRTSSSIAKATGIEVRSVIWHLEKLRREGFVDSVNLGKKYYIIPGLIFLEDMPFFSLLGRREVRKLLKMIWGGCVPISQIRISKSTLYRITNELENFGVVEKSGDKCKYICPTEKLQELVDKYDKVGRDFKKEFLKRIEVRGFEVEVIGTVGYELKIRVRGMENFTMGVFISPLRTALEVL